MIFNSPILSKAGIFFSVERQGTPLLHIPDNVHPGRSGHPLFSRIPASVHLSRVDIRSFSQYPIQIALNIVNSIYCSKESRPFRLVCCQHFDLSIGVNYV